MMIRTVMACAVGLLVPLSGAVADTMVDREMAEAYRGAVREYSRATDVYGTAIAAWTDRATSRQSGDDPQPSGIPQPFGIRIQNEPASARPLTDPAVWAPTLGLVGVILTLLVN